MAISDDDLDKLLIEGKADYVIELVEELIDDLLNAEGPTFSALLDALTQDRNLARTVIGLLAARADS